MNFQLVYKMFLLFNISFCLLAFPSPHLECGGRGFGWAQHFNLFVSGDIYHHHTDTEGLVCAGGNVSLDHYEIGSYFEKLGGLKSLPEGLEPKGALFVGGLLSVASSTVLAGPAFMKGLKDLSTSPETGVSIPYGANLLSDTVDIRGAAGEVQALSKSLTEIKTDPSVDKINSNTEDELSFVTSKTQDELAVFQISGMLVAKARRISISALGNPTVVINVNGPVSGIVDAGINLVGIDSSKVIFNFADAYYLRFLHVGLYGIILAPKAYVRFSEGVLSGQLLAKTLVGGSRQSFPAEEMRLASNYNLRPGIDFSEDNHGGQINQKSNVLFTGCLPITGP